MIIIFSRELIKTGLGFAGGLILALIVAGTSNSFGFYLLFALYVLGLVYSISSVGPWILSLISSVLKFGMNSIIFKSLLGFIVILIAFPIGLILILTVGCVIGLFNCIKNLITTFPGISGGIGFPRQNKSERSWANNSNSDWGRDLLSDYQGHGSGIDFKAPNGGGGHNDDDLLF